MKSKKTSDLTLISGKIVGVDLSSCTFVTQLLAEASDDLGKEQFDLALDKYTKISQVLFNLRLGCSDAKTNLSLSKFHAESFLCMGLICELQSKYEDAMRHLKDSLKLYQECRNRCQRSMRRSITVRMILILTRAGAKLNVNVIVVRGLF